MELPTTNPLLALAVFAGGFVVGECFAFAYALHYIKHLLKGKKGSTHVSES